MESSTPQFNEKERKMFWRCIALSKDHKPNLEVEKQRIIKAGGRVSAIYDPVSGQQIGPHWVWLKDMDIPGLAMSWSLGDDIVRPVGVIGDPEIWEIELEEQDKFIVLASDGVWEFISNWEVLDMVIPFWEAKNPVKAAEALEKESVEWWKMNNPQAIDDISVIVIFLEV